MEILVTGFERDELSLAVCDKLRSACAIILHTGRCGAAEWAKENHLPFETLDDLYDGTADYDEHIRKALERLNGFEGAFCVMDDSDELAKALLKRDPGIHVFGNAFSGLLLRADGACLRLSAIACEHTPISPLNASMITEIDNRILAGEVKLRLIDLYGEDARLWFRDPEGNIMAIRIENLDRMKQYDHHCACLVEPGPAPECTDFESLKRKADGLFSETEEDDESIAVKLAQAAAYIAEGEAEMSFTQADLFRLADKIIDEGEL